LITSFSNAKLKQVTELVDHDTALQHRASGDSHFRFTHVRVVAIERVMHWRKVVVANAR